MKLKEITKQQFKGTLLETRFICIYTDTSTSLVPDYADEILETYGDKEVVDFKLITKNGMNILVVEFKQEDE